MSKFQIFNLAKICLKCIILVQILKIAKRWRLSILRGRICRELTSSCILNGLVSSLHMALAFLNLQCL